MPSTTDRAAALMRRSGATVLPLRHLADLLHVRPSALERELDYDHRFHLLRTPPVLTAGADWTAGAAAAYGAVLDRAGLGAACVVVLADADDDTSSAGNDLARTLAALLRHPETAGTLETVIGAAAETAAALTRLDLSPVRAPGAPSTTPLRDAPPPPSAPPRRPPPSSRRPRGRGYRRG